MANENLDHLNATFGELPANEMSVRTWLAGLAMNGILSDPAVNRTMIDKGVVEELAVLCADRLIAKLVEPKP